MFPIPLIGVTVVGRAPFGIFTTTTATPPSSGGGMVDPRFSSVFDELYDQQVIGSMSVDGRNGGEWTVQLHRFDLDQALAANRGEQGGVVASSFSISAPLTLALTPTPGTLAPAPSLTATWKNAGAGTVRIRATSSALASTIAALTGPARTAGYRLILTVGTAAGPAVGLDRQFTVTA